MHIVYTNWLHLSIEKEMFLFCEGSSWENRPVGLRQLSKYSKPSSYPHVGTWLEMAGFITRNSKEVLVRSGFIPQVQVPPHPPERQSKGCLFFLSPSWPKPVRKPFADEKRVFSILLSPALIVSSVCKYFHLFCRCTVGLDASKKSLALPYSKLFLRNLQRCFTVTVISSSVQPTSPFITMKISPMDDVMPSIGDFCNISF